MNGILGMSQLLLTKNLDDTQRHYAETIKRSGDALLLLINDILDFSKIEAGKLAMEMREFDLMPMLTDLGNLMQETAREKGIDLRMDLPDNGKIMVTGDEYRLRQVLLNLLSNGIKFTDQGEVSLNVSKKMHSETESLFRFEVSDTGIGISRDEMKTIFDTFSQADNSTTRRFGGTGLGLSISSQLVSLMGGEIEVDSEEGRGSTFSFSVVMKDESLKVTEEFEPVVIASSAPAPAAREKSRPTRTILVAEDNATNQEVVSVMLESLGYKVILAENGRDALRTVASEQVDLVMMDYHMPIMDGLLATKAIRELEAGDPGRSRLPILMVTADVQPSLQQAADEVGIDGFLSKPYKTEQLRKLLSRNLDKPMLRVV